MSLSPRRRYCLSAPALARTPGMLLLLLLQLQWMVLLLAVVLVVHPGNAFLINHHRFSSNLPIKRYGNCYSSLRHRHHHRQSLRLNYYFDDDINNGIFQREGGGAGKKLLVKKTTSHSSQLQLFAQTNNDDNKQDDSKQDEENTRNKNKTKTSKIRTWDESYKILAEYYKEHGDSNVPGKYKKDPKLGDWVKTQRIRKNRLSVDKIALLEALDFIWNGEVVQKQRDDEKWEEMFQSLVQYKKENGNCNVPRRHKENQELANWVQTQRRSYTNSVPRLTPYRIQKLDSIGFVWRLKPFRTLQSDIWDGQWDDKYEELVMYKEEHGDCNVPRDYEPNPPLGDWVLRQRNMNSGLVVSGSLRTDRKERLDDIGFDWDFEEIRDKTWLSMYNQLKKAKKQYDENNLVRETWASQVDQNELWGWEINQQNLYTTGKLDPQREAMMEEIGYWKSIGLKRR